MRIIRSEAGPPTAMPRADKHLRDADEVALSNAEILKAAQVRDQLDRAVHVAAVDIAPEPAPGHELEAVNDDADVQLSPEEEKARAEQHKTGLILVNIITALYATNFAIVKDMESVCHPAISSLLRFGLASLFFLPSLRGAKKESILAGVEMGGWLGMGIVTQAIALSTTEASRSAFIAALTVVIVPVIEAFVLRAKIKPNNWAAAFLAVGGVALLESSGNIDPNIGDLFSFLMAFSWAVAFIRLEKYSKQHDAMVLTAGQLLGVILTATIWLLIERPPLDIPTLPWHEVLYTGAITTALTTFLETVALKSVSAVETTVIFALEPVWAAGFAYFLLGEQLETRGVLGGLTIMTACAVSQLENPKQLLSALVARVRGGPADAPKQE
eukprot:tig00020961_g16677.t1